VVEEGEFNRENFDRSYRLNFTQTENRNQYHPSFNAMDRDPNNLYGDPIRRINIPQEQPRVSATGNTPTNQQNRVPPRNNTSQQQSQTRPQQQRPIIFRNLFLPFTISPFNGTVNRHQPNVIFFQDFNFFGPINQDFFADNFASNFASNFEDPLTRLIFIQSMNQEQPGQPPASKEAIQNLKRFKMTEEYCKKDEKTGTLEFPTCSVCLTEIAKDEETILIPCGHLYHPGCVLKWLDSHNTCPVCRYELPADQNGRRQTQNSPTNTSQQQNVNINNSNVI
jgi:hypothetical protein